MPSPDPALSSPHSRRDQRRRADRVSHRSTTVNLPAGECKPYPLVLSVLSCISLRILIWKVIS